MRTDFKLNSRVNKLVVRGNLLRRTDETGSAQDEKHLQDCLGWMAAARNVIGFILPDEKAPYRVHFEFISDQHTSWDVPNAVGAISILLEELMIDLENGFLSSIVNQARAEVFDDFVDHGKAYLKDRRKKEAGVIVGVVFEDTIKRVCKNNGIEGEKLDSLISALANQGYISGVMAKRARAAAGVRTKATHAQWDEFEIGDVEAAVMFIEEMILKHLDG